MPNFMMVDPAVLFTAPGIVFVGRGLLFPDPGDTVGIESTVPAHQVSTLNKCLCNEQTVEGIPVMVREIPQFIEVSGADSQKLDVVRFETFPDDLGDRAGQFQAAHARLDRHLPEGSPDARV